MLPGGRGVFRVSPVVSWRKTAGICITWVCRTYEGVRHTPSPTVRLWMFAATRGAGIVPNSNTTRQPMYPTQESFRVLWRTIPCSSMADRRSELGDVKVVSVDQHHPTCTRNRREKRENDYVWVILIVIVIFIFYTITYRSLGTPPRLSFPGSIAPQPRGCKHRPKRLKKPLDEIFRKLPFSALAPPWLGSNRAWKVSLGNVPRLRYLR